MGKSTAAGNVTATEFTTPTVVRDALGRDHVVGPMGNMDDVERERRELDNAGKGEQPEQPKQDDEQPKQGDEQPKSKFGEAPKSVSPRTSTSGAAK